MKTTTTRALALTTSAFVLSSTLLSADQTKEKSPARVAVVAKSKPETKADKKKPSKEESAKAKIAATQSRLALENALAAEEVKKEHAELQAQVARLKLEKELLTETLAIAELKQKQELAKEEARFRKETAQLAREASLAKMEAETLGATFKAKQAEFGIELAELENEVKSFEANKKREDYADNEPVYLTDPLLKNGTLVISDRRIDLNGPIFSELAEHVTERINYYNNKNDEFPIFIVINDSPGGSVMSGMQIMKAMHGSEAPVYVVVKGFAASMAASLTTLAERSFAFPNAVILHHQVLSFSFGNLTETREHTRQLEEWWRRLANPIAKKMGISREEFIDLMYENTVSGDWTEFADQAKKLKWVDHVVSNIRETSLLKNPDASRPSTSPSAQAVAGAPSATTANVIPRLNPKDVLYLYNPDDYYQPVK
ncbi:MAG: ATP-dependent Clp protease proteolytic subunit [Roseibacillus sp.]